MLADRCQSGGGHHRLWLRPRFHQRPTPGRDLLRPALSEANPRLGSVGSAALGPYVADKGFEGEENHRRWLGSYGARVVCPPKRNGRKWRWPKRLRRWAASIRQIIESVYEKLHDTFGLRRERPHVRWQDCGLVWRRGWLSAYLLHVAQRTTRSSSVGFRRLAGLVISTHTKRLSVCSRRLRRRAACRRW